MKKKKNGKKLLIKLGEKYKAIERSADNLYTWTQTAVVELTE